MPSIAVKVLNCQDQVLLGIIAGLDFVYKRHLEQEMLKNPMFVVL
jgi:uncharacterized protein YneF (UPF0154 family)